MRRNQRSNRTTILRALAALAALIVATSLVPAAAGAADFGVTQFEVLPTDTQAGAHADVTTTISFRSERYVELFPGFGDTFPNDGGVRTVALDLPPGLLADAAKAPTCQRGDFANGACPIEAQVGNAEVTTSWLSTPPAGLMFNNPIYNLAPSQGQPAALGLMVGASKLPAFIDIGVDNAGDYHVKSLSTNIETVVPIKKLEITLWGIPADPVHDPHRVGPDQLGGYPSTAPRTPFMVNPTDCGTAEVNHLHVDSYEGSEDDAGYTGPAPTGCDKLKFEPTIKVTPETTAPDTPTGMAFDLEFPQDEDPDGLATPALRDAVVTLPEGMAIDPAQADGLGACTDAQLGIGTPGAAECPEGAKIGSVSLDIPALRKPLDGSIYVGTQVSNDPASGRMFRIFLVADGQGVHFKLEGAVSVDPATGQVKTTFADNPPTPVSAVHLAFKGGPRAVLVNPPTCGPKTTKAHLTSWGGPAADVQSTFQVDCAPGLGSFAPGLQAGTADPTAGAYSPFTLRVTRGDGQQNLSTISATLPEGLLAKLAGVALCGEAEAATGDCPAASQVGTTTVGTGAGQSPLYVPQPGKAPTAVYLAGPYQGAPYSLVVKVPAQAGPFDLGVVTVRNALNIDPVTTRVTATSDPLPQIVGGIPISYRDVRVEVDRPGFTVNPTSCEPMAVESTLTGAGGATANPSSRFQVGGCGALGFSPRLTLRLSGAPPRRGGNPALKAVVTPPEGQANIGRATVVLPETELLEQGHIKTVCTRVQFAADECPAGSVYGHATAWTPLLDTPLEGPVYLRSNGGERKLPDLVADLKGSIHVVLVGYIDSVKRHGSPRIRTRFLSVPDAPVSRFVLEMSGGRKSLLANNTNLCKARPRAEVSLTGQNAKPSEARPPVSVEGCGKGGEAKKKG